MSKDDAMTDTPPYLSSFVLPVGEHEPERVGALDIYRPAGGGRVPAILFVHGGPQPDARPLPRDWPVYRGYGAAAAERGLVGAVADHRLIRGLDQLSAASDDVEVAVGRLRADAQVDPTRIALWFFSGAGLLAGEWLDSRPEWLRCVALTYPRLSAPAGTPELMSAIEVIGKLPDLPVLLTRAGLERADLAGPIEEFVAAAEAGGTPLETIEVPSGRHGFDMLDHTDESRQAVARALDWMVTRLAGDSQAPVRTPPRRRPQSRSMTEAKPPAKAQPQPSEPASQPEPLPAWPVSEATGVVTRHLEALHTGDLDTVLGTFAPNAQLHLLDGSMLSGRRALREHYAALFETGPDRVEVLSRIAEGEWVVDHQVVHGEPEPLRLIVVHRVHAGSIAQVQFLV
jgi:acetyl esterase/lipase